jgi:predicted transcriptional regulator
MSMSTTTIRLPSDLKARVAAAAKKSGKSAHSFILEAIAEKAQDTERASEFHALADLRFADIALTTSAEHDLGTRGSANRRDHPGFERLGDQP